MLFRSTEEGATAHVECNRCGIVLTEKEVIPALGHEKVEFEGKAATCTEAGATAHVECTRCGIVLTEKEVVAAKGHNYVDGKCADCEQADPAVKNDSVPKTGDNTGMFVVTMTVVALLSAMAFVYGKKRSAC